MQLYSWLSSTLNTGCLLHEVLTLVKQTEELFCILGFYPSQEKPSEVRQTHTLQDGLDQTKISDCHFRPKLHEGHW